MLAKFLLLMALPLTAADHLPVRNLIDEHIFGKMKRDGVPHAPLTGDSAFLRRVCLDLTGRLPTVAQTKAFLADKSPDKRDKLVDSLIPAIPTPGFGRRTERPFLDRWAYFFSDLFRNNEELRDGIVGFHNFFAKAMELNIPYDQFVRELLTASTISTWTNGPSNFLARHKVGEGDGYSSMNHEDTADEVAISATKLFLGVDTQCISCHDGARHLEKVNLWLSRKKRADVWRQAAFFGKLKVEPVFGRIPEFVVNDTAGGYDLTTKSMLRLPRYKADVTPTFLLTGEKLELRPGETERQAFARMLTSHPQFARATVNLFWAELMGRGIVDPPFAFDLDRQDPTAKLPAPWTVQPTHPELLDALAAEFRAYKYDLRWLMKLIVKSRAYQLSSVAPATWKESHEDYFARRVVRRLTAEQLWDAISQTSGIFENFQVRYDDDKFKYTMQARFCHDYEQSHPDLYRMMKDFGQTVREDPATERSSMIQSGNLLNNALITAKAKAVQGSRLATLLTKSDKELIDELFLAALSRFPSTAEFQKASAHLAKNRTEGAEDLLWSLFNRLDFIFNF
jgi:hypothetical protein